MGAPRLLEPREWSRQIALWEGQDELGARMFGGCRESSGLHGESPKDAGLNSPSVSSEAFVQVAMTPSFLENICKRTQQSQSSLSDLILLFPTATTGGPRRNSPLLHRWLGLLRILHLSAVLYSVQGQFAIIRAEPSLDGSPITWKQAGVSRGGRRRVFLNSSGYCTDLGVFVYLTAFPWGLRYRGRSRPGAGRDYSGAFTSPANPQGEALSPDAGQ